MTSKPIRLSTNFMTFIPSLTFTDYEWFPWSICNGCGMLAGNAYPSGHLVLSPIVGLACVPFVETRFIDIAMSLLDISPRIPLGTFSILLCNNYYILDINVNAVATLFEVITKFWPFTTNRTEANYFVTFFVVRGQNVVITTNRVATALAS